MIKLTVPLFFLVLVGLISCTHQPPKPQVKEVLPDSPPIAQIIEHLQKEIVAPLGVKIQVEKLHYEGEAVLYRLLDRARKERDFSGYYTKRSIRKIKQFITEHPRALQNTEETTGVPKEVVAAILFLETTYSKEEGKYKALDTLTSLATLTHPLWAQVEIERAKKVSQEKQDLYPFAEKIQWEERAKRIGEKSLLELKAYLSLCEKLGWNPTHMKSSWAGAMGKGQFIPSTALRLMENGNFTSKSLKTWSDTIRLTAMHIQQDGWNDKATDAQKFEAVQKYNGLEAYAKAVFQIQAKLGAKSKEKSLGQPSL